MKKTFSTVIFTAILFVLLAVTGFAAYDTGDVNNDGNVTPADARLALRCAVSLETFTEEQITAADVNKSGSVDTADARTILRVAAGLDSFASADKLNSMLIEPGVLNVAVCADNPPFCYIENGTLKGVDVDVAEKIADSYGLELKLHNMAYDELTSGITDNKCDIVITKMVTGKNDLVANGVFTYYYNYNYQSVYALSDTSINNNLDQLKSQKIGVLKNSISDVMLTNDLKNGKLGDAQIIRYSRYADGKNALLNNEIFAFVAKNDFPTEFKTDNEIKSHQYYKCEQFVILYNSEKEEFAHKLFSVLSLDFIDGCIEKYCDDVVSDSKIISNASNISVAPGSTAILKVNIDSFYGYDWLTIKSDPYYTLIEKNGDDYYLIITTTADSKSDKIVLCLGEEESITYTINVNISKSNNKNYNFGDISYCPDLGAFLGDCSYCVEIDFVNGASSYWYDVNYFFKDESDYLTKMDSYFSLLEKQGFVADYNYTGEDLYYAYSSILFINEDINQAVLFTEHYTCNDDHIWYMDRISVTLSHQF